MPHYVQHARGQQAAECPVWEVDGSLAKRIDVTPSPLSTHEAEPGKDILPILQERFPGADFHKLHLGPGQFHPLMARPTAGAHHSDSPGYNPDKSAKIIHERATASGQLHALVKQVAQICQSVHPRGRNLQSFGHAIRNVLILACTEVESQWKAVLKANGVRESRNTGDYIKLALPMRLAEFSVSFPYYPWMEPIAPFKNWCSPLPITEASKALGWYAAHNLVKHDREENFEMATLERAFEAVTGFFVMMCAQHGWDFAYRGEAASEAFLRLEVAPTWQPSEIYVSYASEMTPVNYQFA